jgi:16S rRNA (guanine966-N2)-methyltransferase
LGRKTRTKRRSASTEHASGASPILRIIGGTHRGRKLAYSGDLRTRPMKDRVREAIFNLLGPAVKKTLAIDLFAGTGALGLEAISRGAEEAIFIERHFPTAAVIRQNVDSLAVGPAARVVTADAFLWLRQEVPPTGRPWVVFCSPPYDFYVDRREAMLGLVAAVIRHAPPESIVVVESDRRLDPALLPPGLAWKTREYPPAVVSIGRQPSE